MNRIPTVRFHCIWFYSVWWCFSSRLISTVWLYEKEFTNAAATEVVDFNCVSKTEDQVHGVSPAGEHKLFCITIWHSDVTWASRRRRDWGPCMVQKTSVQAKTTTRMGCGCSVGSAATTDVASELQVRFLESVVKYGRFKGSICNNYMLCFVLELAACSCELTLFLRWQMSMVQPG